MISRVFALLAQAVAACVLWFDSLVAAIGAQGLIVGAVGIVFIVSLFLMPLRGAAISSFASASVNHIKSKSKTSKSKKGGAE